MTERKRGLNRAAQYGSKKRSLSDFLIGLNPFFVYCLLMSITQPFRIEQDEALERWLREEVVAGHAEYLADPSKGVPADDIMPRLKARRAAKSKS